MGAPHYSEGFKRELVKKMLGEGKNPSALAEEVGVSPSTLWRWQHAVGTVDGMGKRPKARTSKSVRKWRSEEKLRIVQAASSIADKDLGEFLRREGIHESQLTEWREAVAQGAIRALDGPKAAKRKSSAESKRIKELERELRRKDKALAEAAALLVLQKKVQAIWGDGDDDTGGTKGE